MNSITILFDILSTFSILSFISLWKESTITEVSFKFKDFLSIKFSFLESE